MSFHEQVTDIERQPDGTFVVTTAVVDAGGAHTAKRVREAKAVVLAIGYHHACGSVLKKFEAGVNQRSHTWFRWFNEVPVVLLARRELEPTRRRAVL